MEAVAFKDATRAQFSLLAPTEKRALHWLARRMPAWVGPDHLTLLGFAAMLLAGLCYYLSQWSPSWLHLVNLTLAVNWFGDSLDGTLARYRNKQRPRYGFYVDHIIDAFSTLSIFGGLALSGYMSERIALGLLIVYFMASINVYLATYTMGTFRLSFWKLSPTEGRLILALGNLVVCYHPHILLQGHPYLLYDIGGVALLAVLVLILIGSVVRNTLILYRAERV
ncbi:MAG: CDP-alcohol phosphatidyltransferase family protein [Candidatus Latescibacteria bacterium]|nr:CDP-alcohol phosphatidyltransferase family protein [Candidatus Latescibacterota bacterium]